MNYKEYIKNFFSGGRSKLTRRKKSKSLKKQKKNKKKTYKNKRKTFKNKKKM